MTDLFGRVGRKTTTQSINQRRVNNRENCLNRVFVVSWRELSERCPLCSTTILSLYSTMKNNRLRETVSDVTTTFWERSNYNLMSVPSSAADVEQMARSLKPRPLFMIRLCPTFCAAPCRSVIAKYACLAHTLWTLVKCAPTRELMGSLFIHPRDWSCPVRASRALSFIFCGVRENDR